jgi:hypothetical protein
MLNLFEIDLSQFRTEYTEVKQVICIKAFNTNNGKLVGKMPKDVRLSTTLLSKGKMEAFCFSFLTTTNFSEQEVHTIEQSLDMNPIALNLEMWRTFCKFDLCRTPKQELSHQFKFANKVGVPPHSFAIHVNKMLNCFLQSSEATKHMDMTFVEGEQLQIDAGFFESTWQIHNTWLTYDGAHETAFCQEHTSDYQDPFTCDHVILQLWDIILSQLMTSGEHPRVAAEEAWLKSMARARLMQMPRSVGCFGTSRSRGLQVIWESVAASSSPLPFRSSPAHTGGYPRRGAAQSTTPKSGNGFAYRY